MGGDDAGATWAVSKNSGRFLIAGAAYRAFSHHPFLRNDSTIMRDILVVAIFFFGVLMSVRRPYVAALLWVWIGLMNPHRMGWGFAYSFPFGVAAAGMLFLSMMINPKKVRWPKGGPVLLLLLFVVWMGITTLGAIFFDESLVKYIDTLKVLLMTLVVAAVVRTREEILGFVLLTASSIAFFGIKGGLFTIAHGGSYRVWGPTGSVITGNNELAVALVITVPLLYFLALQVPEIRRLSFPLIGRIPEKWMRRGFHVASVLCLAAALGSHSRGALLAMSAMGAMLWWRSKSKVALGLVILVVAAAGVAFMPAEWSERMNTINTYEEDESAMGRINAWTMAINIANDRVLGAGFVTDSPIIYLQYAPNPNFVIVAHSIYFQILGEHGYIGLLLYLSFWLSTYLLTGRVIRRSRGEDDLQWAQMLGSMCKVSLVGFAVGGAFLSLAYWDMPFYIMAILVCTERLLQERSQQKEKAMRAAHHRHLASRHTTPTKLPNASPSGSRAP